MWKLLAGTYALIGILAVAFVTIPAKAEKSPIDYGQILYDGDCHSAPYIPYGKIVWVMNNSTDHRIRFTIEIRTDHIPAEPPTTESYTVEAGGRINIGCSEIQNPMTTFTYRITGATY